MAGLLQFLAASLFLYSLITISQFHFTCAKPSGLRLKIIPRDCPESPLYPGDLTQLERIQRFIKFSEARAQYLESISTVNSTISYPENIRFQLLLDGFVFMVQAGIGTPETHVFLSVDTGGGLIWTQCEPCNNCYPQAYPIYDSRASSTYRKLPCDHRLCQGDRALYQCVNGECIYNYGYGSGESTKGVASLETFEILVGQTTTELVPDIIFGCSNESDFTEFAKTGVISGILGLSLSPDSLVTQLFDEENRRFCHCFVPFPQAMMSPSFLRFGNDIPLPSANIHTTPFVTPPWSHHYHLKLQDISVGFHRIGFHPDTFGFKQDGSGGCIIDSGTLISHIDQNTIGINAFFVVMSAFQSYYDSVNLQRVVMGPAEFTLCYQYPQDFKEFATMTYHFEGADYVVDSKYVNFYDTERGYFCVALLAGNGLSILGAWHQQDMRITYDANIGALQFATETCANDHNP